MKRKLSVHREEREMTGNRRLRCKPRNMTQKRRMIFGKIAIYAVILRLKFFAGWNIIKEKWNGQDGLILEIYKVRSYYQKIDWIPNPLVSISSTFDETSSLRCTSNEKRKKVQQTHYLKPDKFPHVRFTFLSCLLKSQRFLNRLSCNHYMRKAQQFKKVSLS